MRFWCGIFLLLLMFSTRTHALNLGLSLTDYDQKYGALHKQEVLQKKPGFFTFDRATLVKKEGINFLFLEGDMYEMAYQHARLLKEEILVSSIPRLAKYVPDQISRNIKSPLLQKMIEQFLKIGVYDRFIQQTPEEYRAVILALQKATGISSGSLFSAITYTPTLFILANFLTKEKIPIGEFGVYGGITSNCSSFVAFPEITSNKKLIIGRNLDYPLHGSYDKYPTVIYYAPSGGEQSYMTFSSAGVHVPGITGINAAGIYIAMHVVPSRFISPMTEPFFVTSWEVLRKARNLDEAIAILTRKKADSGWNYLVVSTKEQRAATIGVDARGYQVSKSSFGAHIQTNHFLDAQKRKDMLYINRSIDEDSWARYKRLLQLLEENKGKLDLEKGAEILADQFDPLNQRLRSAGNTIAVHTTVGSYLLQPEDNLFYLALGKSPVQHGTFIEIPPLGTTPETVYLKHSWEKIENTQFIDQHPQYYKALQKFVDAKNAYERDDNLIKALEAMNEVVKADPSNPHYWFIHGVMSLKMRQFADAEQSFQHILALGFSKQKNLLAHYYLGKIFSDRNELSAAEEHFNAIIKGGKADIKLTKAAQKSLLDLDDAKKRTFNPESIGLLMQQADVQNY